MLAKHITGHSSQKDVTDEILSRVGKLLADSKLRIQFDEYRGSIVLEGQRIATGKNTVVIQCDDGDPDVDVMVDTNCCGG